jgi:O-antigen ligase
MAVTGSAARTGLRGWFDSARLRPAAAGSVFTPACFELPLVLFLFAGRFKQDPRFAWVPVDLTAAFFVLSLGAGAVVLARRNLEVPAGALRQAVLALAFFGWAFATLIWSPGGPYATQKGFAALIFCTWSLAATALIIAPDPVRTKRVLFWVCAFAVWVAVETLLLVVNQGAVEFIRTFESDYLSLGSVLSVAASVLLAVGIGARLGLWQFLLVAVGFLGFVLVLLPLGGRGPLIGVVLAVVAGSAIVLTRPLADGASRGRSLSLLILLLAAAVAGGAALISGDEYALAADRFSLLLEGGLGESAAVRLTYYARTLGMIADHPLLGVGIGGWPVQMGFGMIRDYPHNLFLETQAEAGLPGTLLLAALLAYSARLWFAQPPHLLRLAALLVFLNLLVGAMFSNDLADNRVLFWAVGLLGAAAGAAGRAARAATWL